AGPGRPGQLRLSRAHGYRDADRALADRVLPGLDPAGPVRPAGGGGGHDREPGRGDLDDRSGGLAQRRGGDPVSGSYARVAVVTGAAGGIGLAVCAGLAAAGWTVAATDLPGTSVRYEADLREPAAAGALIGAVTGDHGRLDLLVNNAATMYHGELRAGDL